MKARGVSDLDSRFSNVGQSTVLDHVMEPISCSPSTNSKDWYIQVFAHSSSYRTNTFTYYRHIGVLRLPNGGTNTATEDWYRSGIFIETLQSRVLHRDQVEQHSDLLHTSPPGIIQLFIVKTKLRMDTFRNIRKILNRATRPFFQLCKLISPGKHGVVIDLLDILTHFF